MRRSSHLPKLLVPLALAVAAVAGLWPWSEAQPGNDRERSEQPHRPQRTRRSERPVTPAAAAPDSPAQGSVRGLVLDETGRPLGDVLVRLVDGALAATLADRVLAPHREPPLAATRDGLGGEGEPGAADDPPPVDLALATDAAGRFAFEGLPEGEYLLVAKAEAFPPVDQLVALDRALPIRELTLVLAAGQALLGRVVDEAGQPVPGATLTALVPPDEPVTTRSAADGSFALPAMARDGFDLVVEAAGFLPAELFARPARPLHVELERPRALEGLVLDGGRPAAGATVQLDQGMYSASADARGRFRFDGLRPGLLTIDARLGMASAETLELDLTKPPPAGLTLELLAAGAAQLRVEDEAGAPIAGATVEVLDAAGEPELSLHAGTDGLVLVPEAAAGLLWVSVAAQGFAGTSVGVEISSGRTAAERVVLARAAALEVLVLHEGRPLLGADVTLRSLVAGRIRRTVRSSSGAADGRFRFEAVPVGRYTVLASHPELPGVEGEVDVPGPTLVLDLPAGLSIAGRVSDEAGRPVHGAIVNAEELGEEPERTTRRFAQRAAQSGSDGTFLIEGLSEGSYQLVADAQGMIAGTPALARAGESGVTLVLRQGLSLQGVVVDAAGLPVRDVFVTALSAKGDAAAAETTDAAGAFFLDGLEDEELELFADLDGRESPRVRARPGGGEVRLKLPPGATVRGRVVGPDGRPLPLFFVEGEAFHDPDGRFELAALSPEVGTLLVSAARLPDRLLEVELRPGAVLDLGTVAMQAGLLLGGLVHTADGSPAAGAQVHVRMSSGEEDLPGVERAATDADGRFELVALPPGTATVFAVTRGAAPSAAVSVELRAGPPALVTLTLGAALEAAQRESSEGLPSTLLVY